MVSVVSTIMHALSGEGESGLASGLVSTTQQMGGALGIAVLSTLAFARVDVAHDRAPGAPSSESAAALTEGFQLAFYSAAGLALGGIVLSLVVITSGSPRRE